MHIKEEVSVRTIAAEAEHLFRSGFYCSEAVVSAIRTHFELDAPEVVIAMASGFPVGIGRSGCMCGAVSGGVMALGLIFGRTVPGDAKSVRCMALAKELHDWFKESNGKGTLCCRALTREFDLSKGEHRDQCIRFTGMVAGKVAQIIIREMHLTNLDTPTA